MNCLLCEEPMLPGEELSPATFNGQHVHYECGLRQAVGSVAHIEKRCLCYVPGSSEHDDPTLTARQAARAAVAAYEQQTLRIDKLFGDLNDLLDQRSELEQRIANDVPTTDQN